MALTSGFMLSDLGVPDNSIGGDGDHYRDTATQNMYFKQSGAWDLVGSLTTLAPDGVGTAILQGSGSPFPVNGVAGNYYRNTDNQDLWYKTGSGWELVGTLVATAAEGTVILAGSGAPSNANGLDGNYYRNTNNQDVYLKTSGTWGLIGSWATGGTAGTLIRSGSGAPSNGLGNDGEYYRNEDTEDVYYKDGGAWLLIGNWSGSGASPFVVGTWSMIGITAPSTPVTAVAGTVGGSAPNWTLTPDGSGLPGVVFFASAAETGDGVELTGTGEAWARVRVPTVDPGDNIVAVGLVLLNSSADFTDWLTRMNGSIPTNPVWGASLFVQTSDGDSTMTSWTNNTPSDTAGPAGYASGDEVYLGIDLATGVIKAQRNTGTVVDGAVIDLTGLPPGDTFRVVAFVGFMASTPSFVAGSINFDPSTTNSGKTGFSAVGSAIPPIGAVDGDIFRVTTSGTYDGQTPAVGDHVQFHNTLANIIVYPSKASVSLAQSTADAAQADAAQAIADAAAAQADAAMALGSPALAGAVDVMGRVDGIVEPGVTIGPGLAGQLKNLFISSAGQTFYIGFSGTNTARFYLKLSPTYSPSPGDTVTIGVYTFPLFGLLSPWILEYLHVDGIGGLRIIPTEAQKIEPLSYILGDLDTVLPSLAHMASSILILDNSSLTAPLAAFSVLNGSSWASYWRTLHRDKDLIIKLVGSTAHGITNFDGTGSALNVGEAVLIRANENTDAPGWQYLKMTAM